jgi:hypothetical protein
MDSREDLPRISVETIQDWQRVKNNFANTVFSTLDARLSAGSSSLSRDTILQHLNQVRVFQHPFYRD